MLERRRALALATLVFVLALMGACADDAPDLSEFFPTPEEPVVEPEPGEPESVDLGAPSADALDLTVAPATALEAVQIFFTLVTDQRFEDAYRMVTTRVRETTDVEAFAQRYREIFAEGAITRVTYEVPPPPGPDVAWVDVILHYESTVFGLWTSRCSRRRGASRTG